MRRLLLAIVCCAVAWRAFAGLDGSYVLPADHAAIQYSKAALCDPVSKLAEKVKAGEVKLEFDPDRGYLPALLRELKVPVSSQVLVFSKTSFQAPRIAPKTPRALYFNDSVSVGWVRGGDVMELAAVDPQEGVIFYTIDQEAAAKPRIDRRDECLQCHSSGGTLGVPGLVVRSVYPGRSGMPMFHAGSFTTDHRSPMKERWGGWYVTGTHPGQHMGNIFAENRDKPDELDRSKGSNVTSLKDLLDTTPYLTPHSDIVALMVLEHQTRMVNLITRVNWETRMALYDQQALNKALGDPADTMGDSAKRRIRNAADELVKYMLFLDEPPLDGAVKGTSDFAREFAAQGPKDRKGRSLRELDLKTRLFRYPCSYVIYSDAFRGLPKQAKDIVMEEIPKRLKAEDRVAVMEILADTVR